MSAIDVREMVGLVVIEASCLRLSPASFLYLVRHGFVSNLVVETWMYGGGELARHDLCWLRRSWWSASHMAS